MKHLKILLLSSVLLTLNGCALYDAYMMAGYDDGEYQIATILRTQAEIGVKSCDNPKLMKTVLGQMQTQSLALKNYTQHIPDNEDAHELATNLNKLVDSTAKIYQEKEVSTAYCNAKMKLIVKDSEKVQKVLGSKPR